MDLRHLRASDGTGEAVLAHIQTTRLVGSTVLDLDNVDNWSAYAIVITGTPAANGFVSPVGMKVMYGHLNAGDFIIDGYAPGYVDNGNTTNEVAIVKMTTSWADTLATVLSVAHQDNGKLKTTALDDFLQPIDLIQDFVASGCVLTGTGYGSTLAWSLTAGVVYINGKRYTVAAATGVVVATKDTYFDVLMPVSGTVATLVYTGGNSVANNAASPALAANSIRIGIIQSGANIASVNAINQGQDGKVLPISGGFPYAINDSLGNRICRRNPTEVRRGFGAVQPGLSVIPAAFTTYVKMPMITKGRSLEIDYGCNVKDGNSGATRTGHVRVLIDGVTAVGDLVWQTLSTGVYGGIANHSLPVDLAAGFHTIELQISADTGSASTLQSAAIKVTEP